MAYQKRKNIRYILTDLSPEFIKLSFIIKRSTNITHVNGLTLNLPSAQTTYYGTNSLFFMSCMKKLPLSIKQSQLLLEFKSVTKTLRNITVYVRYVKSH